MAGEPRAPRLYVRAGLAEGANAPLSDGQSHYLRRVMRLGRHAAVKAFNESDGEWLCRLAEPVGGRTELIVERHLQLPVAEPDLWLLFAPIKRGRIDWLVEKATELGVSELWPVWTQHTAVERVNLDRLQAHAIEAAEQSERFSVPALHPPQPLAAVLERWPAGRRLLVCDETGGGEPIAEIAAGLVGTPVALLIGPEGGFGQSELDHMAKLSFVSRVRLGPRVLRAETAAAAGLAVVQAIAGDWRRSRAR
jgi:16S rRNA (uracil1498-N3)-methyltransferase